MSARGRIGIGARLKIERMQVRILPGGPNFVVNLGCKMSSFKAQSAGGRSTAIKLRALALARYKPKSCLNCNLPIEVRGSQKVGEIKVKIFCNNSCAARYNNLRRGRHGPRCRRCKKPLERRAICDDCKKPRSYPIAKRTKGELFARRSNWQSARSSIRQHAWDIYRESGQPKICIVCQYDRHVEIGHRESVSKFPNTATIGEINALTNLVPLCPNHHWEFDNGFLEQLKQSGETVSC